jgi:hypothetical protein
MSDAVPWARVVIVEPDGTRIVARLGGDDDPDWAAVERLARLQLAARRAGARMHLEEVSAALDALLDLAGLRREVGGQAEGSEELLGLEERVDPGDAFP